MLSDRVAIAQTQEAHLCVIKVGVDDIDMSTMRGREERDCKARYMSTQRKTESGTERGKIATEP